MSNNRTGWIKPWAIGVATGATLLGFTTVFDTPATDDLNNYLEYRNRGTKTLQVRLPGALYDALRRGEHIDCNVLGRDFAKAVREARTTRSPLSSGVPVPPEKTMPSLRLTCS